MKIKFKEEVLRHLNIPSVPKKSFDGKKSFKDGVAVVELMSGDCAYAVATFNADSDTQPRIKKTFTIEPFTRVAEVFVVPDYMNTDVESMDLDKESKEAAQRLANEAKELEDNGVESKEMQEMKALPEWVFDNIHNAEEATAFIQQYNSRNKIKGHLPKKEEALKLRLLAIHNEITNKTKN